MFSYHIEYKLDISRRKRKKSLNTWEINTLLKNTWVK